MAVSAGDLCFVIELCIFLALQGSTTSVVLLFTFEFKDFFLFSEQCKITFSNVRVWVYVSVTVLLLIVYST